MNARLLGITLIAAGCMALVPAGGWWIRWT